MTDRESQTRGRLGFLAYACIATALVLVVLLGVWGMYRDIHLNRSTIMNAMVSQLRFQAIRSASHIQQALGDFAPRSDLKELPQDPWFVRYWKGLLPLHEGQLYAAVIDDHGTIVFHSDPAMQDQVLSRSWYDRIVHEVGDDVVEVRKNPLGGGQPSYDIRIPLLIDGRQAGEYHEGVSQKWYESQVAAVQSQIVRRWSFIIGANLVCVLLAGASLYYLASHSHRLHKAIGVARLEREAEIGQLAAGLAHEIRNPLHAIRLNLHALRRVNEGRGELTPEEIVALTAESQHEIDRVDQLLRELLSFANPEEPRNQKIDICEHVQATMDFLSQEMKRGGIEVGLNVPGKPVLINMDPNRVRQVIRNLLINAKEALDHGGAIAIRVSRNGESATLSVSDNGPGVPETDRQRIFEPFFTTKAGGTGFGLALAKRYVNEAGGTIACVQDERADGSTFRVRLPLANHSS